MYPKTLSGLAACYVAALPFFRNSVVAELLCSSLLFGLARYSQAMLVDMRIETGLLLMAERFVRKG